MDESKFDELFERIYGFRPRKRGASYELIAAAAIKLIREDLAVKTNQFVEGTYSKEKYQIDAAIDSLKIAVEAKDYSGSNKKVGRPDVTKLAGALQDLPLTLELLPLPRIFHATPRNSLSLQRSVPWVNL